MTTAISLYDLATWINGRTFKDSEFSNIGKPVIKIAELKNGIADQTRFSNQIFDEKYSLKKGDMLFSWSGNPDTSIDTFIFNLENGLLNQHIFKVLPKDKIVDKYYLFYLLKSLKGTFRNIAANKQTTGLGHVTIADIKRIIINLPNKEKQKEIALFLSSFDDKIETNQKIISNIEKITQLLFKNWFIDFEFPNKNGKPYKSNGGEMVNSDLGLIPEKWKERPLSEIFDFLEGPGIRNWQYAETGTRFINIRLINDGDIDITRSNFINQNDVDIKYQHFLLKEKDIVLSTSGTLGRSAIVRKSHLPLLLNTSVIRFRPKLQQFYEYMYCYLKSKIFLELQASLASGSVQSNFGPTHLNKITILCPTSEIVTIFNQNTEPLIKLLMETMDQNEKLISLRNLLLPKLIDGKIIA